MAGAGPVPDTAPVPNPDPRTLLREGVLDPDLAALLWLLLEGGTPLVVTGPATTEVRSALAASLLSLVPGRAWSVIDADDDPPSTERLAALLRGGTGFAVVQSGESLREWMSRAAETGLPEDGVRRLGVVVVAEGTARGLRCLAVHYLRPSERDGQGHVQRRPPAVLATWDADSDAYEDFSWGITPELADRVDRAQADLEERQRDRAGFLASIGDGDGGYEMQAARYLEGEPPRQPAPAHEPARPSPFGRGLTDPDPHAH